MICNKVQQATRKLLNEPDKDKADILGPFNLYEYYSFDAHAGHKKLAFFLLSFFNEIV